MNPDPFQFQKYKTRSHDISKVFLTPLVFEKPEQILSKSSKFSSLKLETSGQNMFEFG